MNHSIFINGLDTCNLQPGTSIDLMDNGNGSLPLSKVILKLGEANDETIAAVVYWSLKIALSSAIFFYGQGRDVLLMLYLNADVSEDLDYEYIAHTIPGVLPLIPINTMEDTPGRVWMGDPQLVESMCYRIL